MSLRFSPKKHSAKKQPPHLPGEVQTTGSSTKKRSVSTLNDAPSKEHIWRAIHNAQTHGNDEQCLEFSNVPEHVALAIINQLQESNESRSHRFSYNSVLNSLAVVTMPTKIHECHASWFMNSMMLMTARGFLSEDDADKLQCMGSPDNFPFTGVYIASQKEPDLVVLPEGAKMPTIVFETGWSESRKKLHEDMRIWMNGGAPHVKLVFVIKWTRHASKKTVKGDLELFRRDSTGAITSIKEDIFPAPSPPSAATQQVIKICRGELWGQHLPAGQIASDEWDLELEKLRKVARPWILEKGFTPA